MHRDREPAGETPGAPGGDADTSGGALEELMRRTAVGDDAAFARLYDMLVPRVFGLAVRVVRDPAHAEEVVQEAMVQVWRCASQFDPVRGPAVAWILNLTHRRAVDRVRSMQASIDRERQSAARSADVEHDDVVDEITTRLEQQAVRRCLETLTRRQSEAITLAYYQGYTYQQVAALVGAALPAVKSRMRDGLIRLRDCLGVST